MIEWRKSSRSGGVNDEACVELARIGRLIGIRDSKAPNGPKLVLSEKHFAGLLKRVKSSQLGL